MKIQYLFSVFLSVFNIKVIKCSASLKNIFSVTLKY